MPFQGGGRLDWAKSAADPGLGFVQRSHRQPFDTLLMIPVLESRLQGNNCSEIYANEVNATRRLRL